MNVVSAYKKRATVLLILGLLVWVLAAGLLLWVGRAAVQVYLGPKPLENYSINGLAGRYVKVKITTMVDEYALLESQRLAGGKAAVTGREYAVYLPDGEQVIGLLITGDQLDQLEPALAALLKEGPAAPAVELSGTMMPMQADSREMYRQALDYHSISENLALPYLLVAGQVGGQPTSRVVGLFWGAVALLVLGCVLLVAARITRGRGKNTNQSQTKILR